MRRSGLFKALCAVIAIMIFAGMASSAPKKKKIPVKAQPVRDTITFEGSLILNVGGKRSRVRKSETVSMPSEIRIETQDDHPSVMAGLLEDNGHVRRSASISVRTSKSFKVSGKRIEGVYEIRRFRGEKRLELLRGRTIPAKTGDYYVRLSAKREDKIEDAAVIRYVKIHVDA
ncbi:MAG: hypothetical protein IJR43_05800 [Synergistaceae bacterium]|nr:hypothetical protein [Synergistaceae bacterium]MBQ9628757.1 hypothetical protein [Synergistaceae bacterium]MBR0249811.1 hypothetical protein [Synergistaceae bacterium]